MVLTSNTCVNIKLISVLDCSGEEKINTKGECNQELSFHNIFKCRFLRDIFNEKKANLKGNTNLAYPSTPSVCGRPIPGGESTKNDRRRLGGEYLRCDLC